MPIGIVTDDDFLVELERLRRGKFSKKESEEEKERTEPKQKEELEPEITSNEASILPIERGRGLNNVEVPDSLRALIGITAIESGRAEALALAREFGVSDSSVSAYTNGSTSTASYHSPSPVLRKKINNTKERLGKIARGKLALSLKHITEDKVANAKLRDVAAVATAMAAVVKNMEPETDKGSSQVNIVLYAPKLRAESSYEVIEAEVSDS